MSSMSFICVLSMKFLRPGFWTRGMEEYYQNTGWGAGDISLTLRTGLLEAVRAHYHNVHGIWQTALVSERSSLVVVEGLRRLCQRSVSTWQCYAPSQN